MAFLICGGFGVEVPC
ncbi:hypothetical protein NOL25_26020 [Vibrio parahaemolyticus]|nr:hypothetical protein [Vibrio parahaemolyticus]MCD2151890.1 hypothetical protein [Vibrio parahaemolyticus]MCX4129430.1 hypothetical protein [Vibrio parahaemolyticus]MCX8823951.1 hypothetical protein [Vibrio parahaemolyticus]MCX8829956.1 hypothetical protein [Vibrio parahaemolyticus]MCX8834977.1 hypothetical protein [Vibrio parahaemolyticus]